ncbi:hypothetical protein CTAYLR_002086 [Chrysophaeum taylorii]|uniref:Macrocin O-methyltransferase n=1 Tax=Chrysophaeum taylorii TaxID=2483200 RepID=A0AAD7UMJ8_9STRA|nr:hypothetical protein CTAYLR_002086 [Chrysophaeum taylorii]
MVLCGLLVLVVLILRVVKAQESAELLALDLTVDGQATRLVLKEGQAYVDAARQACKSTTEPFATDNCVSGAVSIIVAQHLRRSEGSANTLASPGLSLVRETLANYDPVKYDGNSPLHVDIELPIQTKRTVCDSEQCWELDAVDGVPPANHTLHVPAWAANTSATSREVASVLDLWRAEDVALLEHRVALERTRKATPVDIRLHRTAADAPVASFDGFYPTYFVLHTPSLYFDAQRIKVAGSFYPPDDGDVCVSVVSSRQTTTTTTLSPPLEEVELEEEKINAPPEACFDRAYNAQLSGFADAQGSHRLTVRLRARNGQHAIGEGDAATFVAAPPLRPSKSDATTERFLNLLRNAVAGWLYLDNAGDDPAAAGPLAPGWTGHTMVGVHKLDWIHAMIEGLVRDGVRGDLIECGAWRGGASIFMKGVLDALEPRGQRRVLVADTFRGFPSASANDTVDTDGWALQNFGVGGAEAVKKTFERYGLFDDRVVLLEGLFNDTLPRAPTTSVALLRLDCDMYRSTLDALDALYDRVETGGIIVHNNWQYTSARAALLHFRQQRNIEYMPLHLVSFSRVVLTTD